MNFFKTLKTKALNLVNNQQTNKLQQQLPEQKNSSKDNQKQVKLGNIVSNFYSKFIQQGKSDDKQLVKGGSNIQKVNINQNINQGVIWCTATPTNSITAKQSDPKHEKAKQTKQKTNQTEFVVIQQQIRVTQQQAANFMKNIFQSTRQYERQQELKVRKARNLIFSNIEAQPIYMSQNSESRILKMQLETSNLQELSERIQKLSKQNESIQKIIKQVLFSGYLWQVNGMDNQNFLQAGFRSISKSTESVSILINRILSQREKVRQFLAYYRKILQLNNKRIKIAKKLKLIQKIKSYKKDLSLESTNIDQVFYIQRNRQKIYMNLNANQRLVQRVTLLQRYKQKIQRQNRNVVQLVESQIKKWVDKGKILQNKHIQKLLIVLYFIRNEKMYTQNNLTIKLNNIQRKDKLIQKISEVKKWQDYKYVNDIGIKLKVKQFLDQLIKELLLLGGQSISLNLVNTNINMTKKKKYLDVRCTQDEYDQQISNGRIQDNNNAYFVPNDSKIVSSNNKASLNQNKNTPKNNIPQIIANQAKKAKQKLQNGIKF